MVKIKICGLRRKEDIEYVNEYKPDYIGFVFARSKRQVTKKQAIQLKALLDPDIKTVGVFVNEKLENIVDLVNDDVIDMIQLHGDETIEYIDKLKEIVPDVEVIKAVRVKNQESIDNSLANPTDYILFDTYSVKEYGGTGHIFDWSMLEGIDRPFFLAGGLDSKNVSRAIKQCKPYAVDISSAVETDVYKDKEKIRQFIDTVRIA